MSIAPAPGNRYCESGRLTEVGCSGYGWALTIHSDNAHSLNFNEGGFNPNGYYRRAYGLPLRCLQEHPEGVLLAIRRRNSSSGAPPRRPPAAFAALRGRAMQSIAISSAQSSSEISL